MTRQPLSQHRDAIGWLELVFLLYINQIYAFHGSVGPVSSYLVANQRLSLSSFRIPVVPLRQVSAASRRQFGHAAAASPTDTWIRDAYPCITCCGYSPWIAFHWIKKRPRCQSEWVENPTEIWMCMTLAFSKDVGQKIHIRKHRLSLPEIRA